MATQTTEPVTGPLEDRRHPRRTTAALFLAGGLLMGLGGLLHPHGSGADVDAHLLTMFESPTWPVAHWLLLAGGVASFLAFARAWRTQAFGPQVQRWLPVVTVGWGFGALELVPHLLARHEAHALAHHRATPVLDVHVLMQVVASPAVGLTGALVAVAVARAARSQAGPVPRRLRRGGGACSPPRPARSSRSPATPGSPCCSPSRPGSPSGSRAPAYDCCADRSDQLLRRY